MGHPILSDPCKNILFCAIWFGILEAEIEPLGTKSRLHFNYLRTIADACSISKLQARRTLLIVGSSTSCTQLQTAFPKSAMQSTMQTIEYKINAPEDQHRQRKHDMVQVNQAIFPRKVIIISNLPVPSIFGYVLNLIVRSD